MNKRLSRISGPKITKKQKLRLLEMMKDSPELEYGNRGFNYMKNAFAREVAVRRWKEIANELNYMDGTVHKEWQSWKKTWSDIRSKMQEDWSAVVDSYLKQSGGREITINPSVEEGTKKLSYISEMFCDGDDHHVKDERELAQLNDRTSCIKGKFLSRSRLENTEENDKSETNLDVFHAVAKTEYHNEKEYIEPPVIQINSRLQNFKESTSNDHMKKCKKSSDSNKKQKISLSQLMRQYVDQKIKVKEKYYSTKMRLLERDVVAKESIASSLKILVEGGSNLFQLPQN